MTRAPGGLRSVDEVRAPEIDTILPNTDAAAHYADNVCPTTDLAQQ